MLLLYQLSLIPIILLVFYVTHASKNIPITVLLMLVSTDTGANDSMESTSGICMNPLLDTAPLNLIV